MEELYQTFGFEDYTSGKSCMMRVNSKATTDKTTEGLILATLYCRDTCKLHETNTCVRISDACYRKKRTASTILSILSSKKCLPQKTMQYVNNLPC